MTSLLFPLVDYCSLVYRGLSSEQDLIIQLVLNRGIRYIYGLGMSQHITPYRRELGWLRASGRRDYLAACMLYKLFARPSPSYLVDYYAMRTSDRPHRALIQMIGREPTLFLSIKSVVQLHQLTRDR